MSLTGCIRRRRQPTCRRHSSTSPPSEPQELQQVHIIVLIYVKAYTYNRVFHGSVGIGEVQGSLIHMFALVPFAEETRLNKFK